MKTELETKRNACHRQSIRSLPKGQFQRIREIFDPMAPKKREQIIPNGCSQTDDVIHWRFSNSIEQTAPLMASIASPMDPSTEFQSTPNTRETVSTFQRTLTLHAKPVLVRTVTHFRRPSNISFSSIDNGFSLKNSSMFDESGIATSSFSSDDVFDSCNISSSSIMNTRLPNESPLIIDQSSEKKFVLQTTSFHEEKPIETLKYASLRRRPQIGSTSSTGFQTNSNSSMFTPVLIEKHVDSYAKIPPKKPPRTFEHESNDLSRSVSCVNLTEKFRSSEESSPKDENIYEELKFPTTVESVGTVISKLKKGVSEPNLTKIADGKSSNFSARALFNRMKRIFPRSSSKQSLNVQFEIDDSTSSSSSELNDDIRLSRLDHVHRVQHLYEKLNNTCATSTKDDYRPLTSLYSYVVHLLAEDEFGYFANGHGCLSSSSIEENSFTYRRFKYPAEAEDDSTLKYFCFPDRNFPGKNVAPEYFRFTLTDVLGHRQHGYCSRFVRKGIFNALCLISPCDLIDFYGKILSTATELFLSYKDEEARQFLIELYPHRLPNRGDTIYIPTLTVGLYTLHYEADWRKTLIDSRKFLNLSTETIIKIFSAILYEEKLIFIADELATLSRVINTFVCLLYPFAWPHTFVPILPRLMLDVAQAPTPFILGVVRTSKDELFENNDSLRHDNADILMLDIDEDRFHSRTMKSSDILPKIFKLELKQEISYLRKNRSTLSLDELQKRLRRVFMWIFVQSCYNYRDFNRGRTFQYEEFIRSKPRHISLFLEWFSRTQIFQTFIRRKENEDRPFAVAFDLTCENYRRSLNKSTSQRVTVKSIKRRSASRIIFKQEHRL